jgi:type I restriction enzyme S subunit
LNNRNIKRPGYKETKIGWIPEDWEAIKLSDIGEFTKGSGIKKTDLLVHGIPCIRYGEIYTTHHNVVKKFYSLISPDVAAISKQIYSGDILFAGSGETPEEIGKCVAYVGKEVAYAGGDVIVLRLSKGHPIFFGYLLNQDVVKRQKYRYGQGHSIVHIYSRFLKDILIVFPPIEEQRVIAEILSAWDEAIELVSKQIEAKRRLMKGLMQQVLTEKMRFPGFDRPWKEMQLGEFLKMRLRKVEKPKEAYLRLGIRSHGKGTFTTIVEDPQSVDMTHLYQVKEGDLIVSITFAWEGAIAIVKSDADGAYVSHRFPTFLFDTQKVVSEFFRYLMHTPRFFYDLGVVSPGGAGRNRVMSKRNFFKIKVRVPSVKEQRLIGGILTVLDGELNKLSELLEQLNFQKQGLMQKLLTGEVRVKV